jgi:hypothetical protein
MELSTLGNIILGIYGAGLTTYTIIKANEDKRRQVTVTISNGWLTYGQDLSKLMLFITMANPGFRTVTLNSPKIVLPDGKSMVYMNPLSDVTFPHELKEGKDCLVWTEMEMIKRSLIEQGYSGRVKLKASVSDRTGKVYKAKKPWILNLEETFD